MALFQCSTQATHWTFPASTLSSHRTAAHSEALKSRPFSTTNPLTEEEEYLIRIHHERRISRFIRQISFPPVVSATAVLFFKRFFVHRSVMDFNPSVIALVAVYSSMKIEEYIMRSSELVANFDRLVNEVSPEQSVEDVPMSKDGTAMRVTTDALLSVELQFLQQIDFHLICYHPFRSLGVIREMLLNHNVCESEEALSKLIARAEYLITRRALVTDLPLQHPPAVIAAAVTLLSGEENSISEEQILQAIAPGNNVLLLKCARKAAEVIRQLPDRPTEDDVLRVAELEKRRQELSVALNDPLTKECQEMQQRLLDEEDELETEEAYAHREARNGSSSEEEERNLKKVRLS